MWINCEDQWMSFVQFQKTTLGVFLTIGHWMSCGDCWFAMQGLDLETATDIKEGRAFIEHP